VYATARRPETLAPLAAAGAATLALDVTDERSMISALEAIEERDGAVGALVNNAGYSQSGAVEEIPIERVRQQFETNVFGPLRLAQLVLPGMRRAGSGRIVNIGSMGGKLTLPGGGVYHATKYALEALSDALRFEVRGFGIQVVLVEPGLIRSGFSEAAVGTMEQVASADGPYAGFTEAVARVTTESYHRGSLAPLAGDPDAVARVVERALQATHPRARYRVTASAHVLMTLRALLPDAMWDAFLRSTYPEPRQS
jgi:NAD(P)-dependent dehydrogenase (short-subunit alcohol dehydrogenase family)